MYSEMEDMPCYRTGKILLLPRSQIPTDISEDDLFSEFRDFGIIDIEINQQGGKIIFETIRGASEAEKYLISLVLEPPMMPGPMMNPAMMGMGPMGMMGHMGPIMMGPMGHMGTMGPMGMMASGASMQYGFPSRPAKVHRPTLMKPSSNANIKVTAKTDGSRDIFSSPEKLPGETDDDSELATGQCTLCKKCTSYTCGRCGIFYCSRECQKQSWPSHQTDCNLHMPPLNFAGRRNMTEVEINGCAWQQRRAREHQGRQSPTVKQWRTQRNDSAEGSQDKHSPRPTESTNGAQANVKDERTQSSSFGRSNERAGGNERRFDERSSNRSSSGSFQRSEPRDERRGDGQRNFNRNRSDDANFDKSRSNGATSSYSKPSPVSQRSPRTMPSNTPDTSAANVSPTPATSTANESPRSIPENSETSESPKKVGTSNTVANLMKNLKLNSQKSSNQPDPVVDAPGTSKPNEVAAPVTPPVASEVLLEKPGCINITTGSKVTISHVDPNGVFLQASENLAKFAQLTSKLADHCASAPTLTRNPKKNEFLAAKFSADNTFYRAVVAKKQNGSYEVNFVDFGNPEMGVTTANMILLTKDLAEVPCMAVKVPLKDVPEITGEALEILQKYVGEETALTMECGENLAAGVMLVEESGENVNSKVLNAMRPTPPPVAPVPVPVVAAPAPAPVPVPVVAAPAPAPVAVPVAAAPAPVAVPVAAAPPVAVPVAAPAPVAAAAAAPAPVVVAPAPSNQRTYSLEDVSYVQFPPVGSTCTVLINHFHMDHGFFMACPVDMEALQAAADLCDKLQALAARTQPHRPAPNELCIAKWSDGGWYRAACLDPAGDDSFNVLFLEYGNNDTVQYPDIRPYAEDLIQVPALSSVCCLSDPESLNEAQKAKVNLMFKSNWTVEAKVVGSEEGMVTLDIPEIKNALK